MYHLCQYEYDTSSANCKHNNVNIDALLPTVEYIKGGTKKLFLKVDNCVTVSGKMMCDMSKVSNFSPEKKRIKLGC